MWSAIAIAKRTIPLNDVGINKGTKITITKGRNEKYALWHHTGIYDLPRIYVGEIIKENK